MKKTLLEPAETTINFDAIITSSLIKEETIFFKKDLEIMGGSGTKANTLYSFEFIPATMQDTMDLEQLIENTILLNEWSCTYSDLEIATEAGYKDLKDGVRLKNDGYKFQSSQLFKPKLNVSWETNLSNKYAHIKAHLRDDPYGEIKLQVEYLDVFEVHPTNEPTSSEDIEIDNDW